MPGVAMNYLPLCLLCTLLPVSGVASAASADNKTSAKLVNSASKTYDAKGQLIQKTDDKGRHYNAKGQYKGKTTRDGKHYDTKGKFIGKTVTAPSGSKSYDAKGKLLQKTDVRGRIYDAKGKYQGKVKPVSQVKSEKRDAKGKLVETIRDDF
jgi:YD repeat-containing protein